MKWGNRDTNVVVQANIPDFSKLDDIWASLRLYQLFFDDALVNVIVGYIKSYGYRKKADTKF